MYFFDRNQRVFLVAGINEIPNDAIAVSNEDFQYFIDERAKGKEIYLENGYLMLTETVRPSTYHHYNTVTKEWEISAEQQIALFNDKKQQLQTLMANKVDNLKSACLVGYPQTEIDSFYRQEREARDWQANHNSPTPMLSAIAENRGVPFDVLVEKVIEKANVLAIQMGNLLGQKQAFEDRLNAADTVEKLDGLRQEIEQWTL